MRTTKTFLLRSRQARRSLLALAAVLTTFCQVRAALAGEPLPGTQPLVAEGDLAAQIVSGIDRYLDRVLAAAPQSRARWWLRETSSPDALLKSLVTSAETNRARLRHILGAVDAREPVTMRFVAPVGTNVTQNTSEVGRGPGYRIFAVAWNVFRGVEGEGLLMVPDGEPKADVLAVPDCDWTPEQAVGLAPGVPMEQQFPRRFAEAGCRVVVPALMDRSDRFAGNPGVRSVKQSQRETLWRASYEMGRTPLGYEIQKLLAAADWLEAQSQIANREAQIGVFGYGEGGLLAFYAGALDTRFRAVGVCGAFGLSQRDPELPIYRNVWSLLERFGDAEVATMIWPRALVVEHGQYPEATHTDQGGGAPGRLWRPTSAEIQQEFGRLGDLVQEPPRAQPGRALELREAEPDEVGAAVTLSWFLNRLRGPAPLPNDSGSLPQPTSPLPDTARRTKRQYLQILEDTQQLMRESEYTRREFWKKADFKSLAGFTNSYRWYRDHFRDEIVGMIPKASLPPNPRSRLIYETNGIRGYEVVLDVHPDVFAYGILTIPAGIKPGERRPVVVCQHGLEGRPRDVADPRVQNDAYHKYAYRLAERGFVTFAPQNAYIGRTNFRQVLRKAQPLGLTLWSFIVRQHEVITDWLAALDFTDPARIAFYGLSYGGKTAMRVPVLVDRYCLSICSADYNEWIWKNVSSRAGYSYLWTGEYDMPEFNLGNTFNYAELSWLICPRPFMVERGHDDGVAPDEWVAYEYAKTRRHYVKLGLADRTEIEFFDGPHTIHGVGTFEFLHKHLKWAKP
jgi:dienelactone hydrolase